MKDKFTTGYIRKVKKLCKSKLNRGYLRHGLNAWAIGVVLYNAGIVA